MIQISEFVKKYGPWAAIYTFVGDDGSNISIASDLLRQHCIKRGYKRHIVPVDVAFFWAFLEQNAISIDRIKELSQRPRIHEDPVIFCMTPEGQHEGLLVDGHHRYALACVRGQKHITAWMLQPERWKPFQILGLEDLTKEQLSRIPLNPRNY